MNSLALNVSQVFSVTQYNFRTWRRNPRVILTFALAFILCFLLSDKVATFAYKYETTMQAFEPFVWTFGDGNSIMLISLLLVLLFADMPFLTSATPYYLVRMNRTSWLVGQALYVAGATLLYMLFILVSTSVICMANTFIGNMWSETAAMLGYSNAGESIVVPALVKTLEMSFPYQCMFTIFGLMLMYTLVMMFVMLLFNIKWGQLAGIVAVFVYNLFGFLLSPTLIKDLFSLPAELMYKANVAVGWISPLNHATYHMHNFGYDLLPRMWHTFAIFGGLLVILFVFTLFAVKKYSFDFRGTEGD